LAQDKFWANFNLSSLCFHRSAWANWHNYIEQKPDTRLAARNFDGKNDAERARRKAIGRRQPRGFRGAR
jgi:hypothetical protein